jgi:hypothetical protein
MPDQLHYRGNHTPFDGTQLLGPDQFSAVYVATSAVYDPDTDRTTVTVRPLSGEERSTRIRKIVADEQRIMRLQRLFVRPT